MASFIVRSNVVHEKGVGWGGESAVKARYGDASNINHRRLTIKKYITPRGMTYLRPERQPPTVLLYRVFEIINRADVCVSERDRIGPTWKAERRVYVRPIKGAVTRAVNLIESLSFSLTVTTTNSRVLGEPLASKSILTFFPCSSFIIVSLFSTCNISSIPL